MSDIYLENTTKDILHFIGLTLLVSMYISSAKILP